MLFRKCITTHCMLNFNMSPKGIHVEMFPALPFLEKTGVAA